IEFCSSRTLPGQSCARNRGIVACVTRQLISAGSLAKRDRASLFLIDSPNRTRLKILGHATVLDANEHPDLAKKLEPEGGHGAKPERIFRIGILSHNWNCPKFITPRYPKPQIEDVVGPLQTRIAEREAELNALKP
ncbi:MAG: hypothetical protein OSA48_08095, partial [Akkermansiaceae bacterium]|nr:hypothetical protein [Akkermansiaceae bacterium]